MGAPFNRRVVKVERRITALETQHRDLRARVIKLDQALEVFWQAIPYEQRLEIIKKIEGDEEE